MTGGCAYWRLGIASGCERGDGYAWWMCIMGIVNGEWGGLGIFI